VFLPCVLINGADVNNVMHACSYIWLYMPHGPMHVTA
jgi:hypothetical protein